MPSWAHAGLLASGVWLATACSDAERIVPTAAPRDGGSDGGGGGGGAAACDVHGATRGPHFIDRSDAWGLDSAHIVGNRIISGDLDGDGYPDLIVHAIGTNNREVVGSDSHLLYVLMNEPRPGGGRTFVDRTAESGYGTPPDGSTTAYRSAQLAVVGDVDNDGDLDVYSGVYTDPAKIQSPPTAADLDRSQLLLNDGSGHFAIVPSSGVQPTSGMPTTGASFVDVNRDGKLDLFVGFFATSTFSPQQLLMGNGDGQFTDVSASAGVTASATRRASYGVTTCDLDGDGVPELLVSAYARGPNVVYVRDASGHYADVGVASGYAYDDDTTYSDNQFFECYCTVHTSEADCQGVGAPQISCPTPPDANWNEATDTKPARLGGNTFTTLCSDVTGDGALDLYNAEITHWWAGESSDVSRLLVHDADPAKIHLTRPDRAAIGMGWNHYEAVDWNEGGLMAVAADLDNDGREDVIVAASDYANQYGLFFHQKADGTFEEIGEASGFHHPCTSGVTIADFDRDGDLDIVVGSGTARDCGMIWTTNEVHFYENDANTSGHFLAVRLAGNGTTANRTGIGARVVVHAGGVDLVKELGGGYGHMALENDTILFFGLGACGSVASIDVTWPDEARTRDTYASVSADRLIELRQGDPTVHDVALGP